MLSIACAAMADLAPPAERSFSVGREARVLQCFVMEGTILDSERFDRLVRSFGQPRSRRQTLRGLAGAAAAGALAVGGRDASADGCKGTGKTCKKDSQCCSG